MLKILGPNFLINLILNNSVNRSIRSQNIKRQIIQYKQENVQLIYRHLILGQANFLQKIVINCYNLYETNKNLLVKLYFQALMNILDRNSKVWVGLNIRFS